MKDNTVIKAGQQTSYQVAQSHHQQALRQGILDDASGLLVNEGPAALSMRRIAKLVGCSTMVLYTLFGSKQGLIEQLFLRGFEILRQTLSAASISGSSIDNIWALCRAYRQFALENATYYAIMFANPIPEHTPSEASRRLGQQSLELLVQAIQNYDSAVQVSEAEAWDLARMIWATLHGHVSLELSQYFDSGMAPISILEKAIQTIVDSFLIAGDNLK